MTTSLAHSSSNHWHAFNKSYFQQQKKNIVFSRHKLDTAEHMLNCGYFNKYCF